MARFVPFLRVKSTATALIICRTPFFSRIGSTIEKWLLYLFFSSLFLVDSMALKRLKSKRYWTE